MVITNTAVHLLEPSSIMKKPIKILYVVSTLKSVGPTNQLYNIIKSLDLNIFLPYVITLSKEGENSRLEDFLALNVPVESLDLSRLSGLLVGRRTLIKKIAEIGPDLIHSQGARPDIFSSLLDSERPRICTVRNFPQIDYKMTYGRFIGGLLSIFQIKAFKKLDFCCCVSSAVAQNLIDFYSINNVKVVLNGVDDEVYYPVSLDRKVTIRHNLGLGGQLRIWLSTIGKDDRKNSIAVANAFKEVYGDDMDNVLIFIGEGKQKSECEAIADGSVNFVFPGKVANVSDYLQASDYFISASKAEGMPNAVLEAMSCGLPVILSNIPPHLEVKELNPNGTYIFDLNEDGSISKVIGELDRGSREGESRSSLNAVGRHFSSVSMSKQYQSIYEEILSGY